MALGGLLLWASGCAVSFDGYELKETSGGNAGQAGAGGSGASGGTGASAGQAGAGGSGASGGTGASAGAGGSGASGGASGSGAGGGTGATGGAGGATGGTAGASGGTGGTTGGTGGTGGGTGGATGGTGGATGGTGGVLTCPSQSGATSMVLINATGGAYCMDATEVSNAQYGAFLAASPTKPVHPACSGNNLNPSSASGCPVFKPAGEGAFPVSCVDWCDADAYCKEVGKRLCGKIGSGVLTSTNLVNAAHSEWYHACSQNDTRLFPYGNLYGNNTCNGLDSNGTGRSDVGTKFQCVGGYVGLYDLSGNLREWEDGCNGNMCPERGGGYLDNDKQSNANNLTCKSANLASRMSVDKLRGFRCCADPVVL
ncbi:MAG TPA: SUMF1/EgtB/PvdO family nonheme iron enzyme [Polyangiaceae bacterium]|nr:SUMF1/EgtB/PvdO family nonheme iron enzyme [Polyangiaceae bacterium]